MKKYQHVVALLSAILLLFTTILSPIGSIKLHATTTGDFPLLAERTDEGISLTMQVETVSSEDIVSVQLVKNEQNSTISPEIVDEYIGEDQNTSYVHYRYLDTEIVDNESYTYEAIVTLEDETQLISSQQTVEALTVSDKVTDDQVVEDNDSVTDEAEQLPLIEKALFYVGDTAILFNKSETSPFELDANQLEAIENQQSILSPIELHVSDAVTSIRVNDESYLVENGVVTIPFAKIINIEEPVTITTLKEAFQFSGMNYYDVELDVQHDGVASNMLLSFLNIDAFVGVEEEVTEPEQEVAEETPIEDEYVPDFELLDITATYHSFLFDYVVSENVSALSIVVNGETYSLDVGASQYELTELESNTQYDMEFVYEINGEEYSYYVTYDTERSPESQTEVSFELSNSLEEYYSVKLVGLDEHNSDVQLWGEAYDNRTSFYDESTIPYGAYRVYLIDYNYSNRYIYEDIQVEQGNDYVKNPITLHFDEASLPEGVDIETSIIEVTDSSIKIEVNKNGVKAPVTINLINQEDYWEEIESIEVTEDSMQFTFENLQPGTSYYLETSANYEYGYSSYHSKDVITSNEADTEFVQFDSAAVETAVKEQLGVYHRDVTTSDMLKLNHLYMEDYTLEANTTFEGLQFAENLKSLSVYGDIEVQYTIDYSVLSEITSLTDLSLNYLQIETIDFLSTLSNLESLRIYGNAITNIEVLAELSNLDHLDLDGNPIQDLTPLLELDQLSSVYLYDVEMEDYDVVDQLKEKGIEVSYDIYDRYSFAIETTNVTPDSITVSWEPVENVEVTKYEAYINGTTVELASDVTSYTFEGLQQDTEYDVDITVYFTNGDSINDSIWISTDYLPSGEIIEFPDENLELAIRDYLYEYERDIYQSDLERLEYLYLYGDNITDLTGLEYATNLNTLSIYGGDLQDLTPLSELTTLESLYLSDNNITNISPLQSLVNLDSVDLSYNPISDFSPLTSLTNLTDVSLEETNLEDVTILESLPSLEYAWIGYNPITSIDGLLQLDSIQEIGIYGIDIDFYENEAQLEIVKQLAEKGVSVWGDFVGVYPELIVTVDDITSNSVVINWEGYKLEDVTKYSIMVNGEIVDYVDAATMSYTLSDLTSNTGYDIRVVALNEEEGYIADDYNWFYTDVDEKDKKQFQFRIINQDGENVTKQLNYSFESYGNYPFYDYGVIDNGSFTSWNGNITEYNLPKGSYELIIYGEGKYSSYYNEIVITDDTPEVIDIELEEVEENFEDITVTVEDQDGNPVTDVEYIQVYDYNTMRQFNYEHGDYSLHQVSSDDGVYTIQDVLWTENQTYDLYVKAPGYTSYDSSISENNIRVTLSPASKVEGTVVDENGSPLIGASISAYGNQSYAYATSNENGFVLDGIKEEALKVEVSMQNYQTKMIEIAASDFQDGAVQIGEIALAQEQFVHGKVFDQEGNPVKEAQIELIGDNSRYSSYWARTDAEGYFKLYNVEDGTYTLRAQKYKMPTVEVENVTPSETELEIELIEQGTGNFTGEGNGFISDVKTVVPGDMVQYRLNYKNNGDATTESLEVTLNLDEEIELVEESVQVNGKDIEVYSNVVTIEDVEANEAGVLSFEAIVAEDTDATRLTTNATVEASEQEDVISYNTSLNVLYVTLEVPSVTGTSNVKVYGNAKNGAKVEIFDGDTKLATVEKVDSKWWYADIKLPVSVDEESTHSLIAKVTEGEQVNYSTLKEVTYVPNLPEITDVEVSSGWNQGITINPNIGMVTAALVELTPIDISVNFGSDVANPRISFLGEEYDFHQKEGSNTYQLRIPGNWSSYGEQLMELVYEVDGQDVRMPIMQVIVLIDPSGYVFEGSMDNRLEGAKAIVEQLQANNEREFWRMWDAENYGQINPQITDEDGRYGWDVIQGDWRVIFSKEGYETYTSRIVSVPPQETELNVPLVRTSNPVVQSIVPENNKKKIETDASVSITFDRLMNESNMEEEITVLQNGEIVEGIFTFESYNGYKEVDGQSGYFEEDPSKKLSQKVIFTPNEEWNANAEITVKISDQLYDYDGKYLNTAYETTFTTAETPGEDQEPGEGEETPGEDQEPGEGEETPGEDQEPGEGEETPGEDQEPGEGEETPGEDQEPGEGEDT
ncbi:carboxypeptidase regulatory-like domain-containing protein, partial [Gracilibacillus marinus]